MAKETTEIMQMHGDWTLNSSVINGPQNKSEKKLASRIKQWYWYNILEAMEQMRAILRGNCIAVNTHIRKIEQVQIT